MMSLRAERSNLAFEMKSMKKIFSLATIILVITFMTTSVVFGWGFKKPSFKVSRPKPPNVGIKKPAVGVTEPGAEVEGPEITSE